MKLSKEAWLCFLSQKILGHLSKDELAKRKYVIRPCDAVAKLQSRLANPQSFPNRERVVERLINGVAEDSEVAHFAPGAGFAFAVEVTLGARVIEHGRPVEMREQKDQNAKMRV